MRRLITISGIGGSGKTALTDALAARIGDALVVKFDEIDHLMIWDEDYTDWLRRGANLEEADLSRMRGYIDEQLVRESGRLVLFDYPHGRSHSAFRDIIDLAFFVDTPLDLALARRLLRDKPGEADQAANLRAYVAHGRAVYQEHARQVRLHCDVVLDGTKPVDELADMAIGAIKQRGFL